MYEQYYLFGWTGCRRCSRSFVLRVALIRAFAVREQTPLCLSWTDDGTA